MIDFRSLPSYTSTQGSGPENGREQDSPHRPAEGKPQAPSFRHLLPATARLLNQIERTSGAEIASAVVAAITAELEHQRLILDAGRSGLIQRADDEPEQS